ncbi:MAG: hypothetical protein V3S70_06090 [Gammaproteobacteria bacterium]
MNIIISMVAAAALATLTACGGASNEEAADENAEAKEGVFDPMVETMDRAREVEDLVQQQKKDIDEALEQAQKKKDAGDNEN